MKTLKELKVVELRRELENRGLPTGGTKAILEERLEEALRNEGHDPTTFEFPEVDDEISGKTQEPAPAINLQGILTMLSTQLGQIDGRFGEIKKNSVR